jgi:hypothetical protein
VRRWLGELGAALVFVVALGLMLGGLVILGWTD